jgi:hypothetical protein
MSKYSNNDTIYDDVLYNFVLGLLSKPELEKDIKAIIRDEYKNIYFRNHNGYTILDKSISNYVKVLKILNPSESIPNEISKSFEFIKILLELTFENMKDWFINVNRLDKSPKFNPLQAAVLDNNSKLVKLLLDSIINSKDHKDDKIDILSMQSKLDGVKEPSNFLELSVFKHYDKLSILIIETIGNKLDYINVDEPPFKIIQDELLNNSNIIHGLNVNMLKYFDKNILTQSELKNNYNSLFYEDIFLKSTLSNVFIKYKRAKDMDELFFEMVNYISDMILKYNEDYLLSTIINGFVENHGSVNIRNLEAFKILLKKGFNPHLKSYDSDKYPISYFIKSGNYENVILLIEGYNKLKPTLTKYYNTKHKNYIPPVHRSGSSPIRNNAYLNSKPVNIVDHSVIKYSNGDCCRTPITSVIAGIHGKGRPYMFNFMIKETKDTLGVLEEINKIVIRDYEKFSKLIESLLKKVIMHNVPHKLAIIAANTRTLKGTLNEKTDLIEPVFKNRFDTFVKTYEEPINKILKKINHSFDIQEYPRSIINSVKNITEKRRLALLEKIKKEIYTELKNGKTKRPRSVPTGGLSQRSTMSRQTHSANQTPSKEIKEYQQYKQYKKYLTKLTKEIRSRSNPVKPKSK